MANQRRPGNAVERADARLVLIQGCLDMLGLDRSVELLLLGFESLFSRSLSCHIMRDNGL